MEKLNFLDEVILDDSEMLEICGGTSDNISCGSNCGNNCGSNCGNDCGHNCGGSSLEDKLTSNPQPIGFSGILLAKRQNSFIVHISCTTEMSQTQNPLTP